MEHPADNALQALTLGRLSTAEAVRTQQHIFNCPDCLKRLLEIELLLAFIDAEGPDAPERNPKKPIFIRHHTADGFIYSRVEKQGRKWLARNWGDQLQGQRVCLTMREANEYAMEAFAQMFPEHRCTESCCLNPTVPA